MLSRASNSGLFSPQQTNAHTKIRFTLFETSFEDSSDGQSWNFTSHFSPSSRPHALVSSCWIIRKKKRKKKKTGKESIISRTAFYYRRSISRARTGPPTGVFNVVHVTPRSSYFRESREIYEIHLEATTSLFEVYITFEKES